ncbi:DUF3857 and transglutaminase domain-containing protein [Pendulispora brunnea]|uniref:DUF3857 and transglutaminase domain-containing protein n=1 Tax=Pendulispora brunnea TaxID=2905690 RepID=A0ABZ2K600_9BACT
MAPDRIVGSGVRLVPWLAFVGLLLLLAGDARAAESWTLRPAPSWRTVIPLEKDGTAPAPAAPNGSRYLLYDHQVRVSERAVESYWHWARVITNEAGLQSNSQVNIEFDASYQRLLLHSIVVRRGAEVLNRLTRDSVKVIQREQGLDNHVYDGRSSAIVFLTDLRVGDIVEYAYTLDGGDPTLDGRYADVMTLGSPEPIDRLYVRLVMPHGRRIAMALHGPPGSEALVAQRRAIGSDDEYVWDLAETKSHAAETQVPSWYDVYPWVQISEYETWHQVAVWGTELFRVPSSVRLHDWVAKSLRESGSPDEFLARTIRFVQDEVRYLGIEVGLGRRRPAPPDVVFQRRYGDCKDKTALLVALLQEAAATGLRARPALVNTTHGHVLDHWAPSPGAFDHVIVRVEKADGTIYWIDPTMALQGGGLERLRDAPYERALILDAATTALESVPNAVPIEPSPSVRDHFVVPAPGSTDPARLDSERRYQGVLADAARVSLRTQTAEQLAKGYLELYKADYPGISERAPLEQVDDRERNVVTVSAHFVIPNYWTWQANEGRYIATAVARSIDRSLVRPAEDRKVPLAVPYPFRMRYLAEFELPFDLTSDLAAQETVRSRAMELVFQPTYANRALYYQYDLTTLADVVDPREAKVHAEKIDRVQQIIARSLTYRTPPADGFNWGVFVVVFGFTALTIAGAIRVYRSTAPRSQLDVERELRPMPVGGLLALLGLQVAVAPFILFVRAVSELKTHHRGTLDVSPGAGRRDCHRANHGIWAHDLCGAPGGIVLHEEARIPVPLHAVPVHQHRVCPSGGCRDAYVAERSGAGDDECRRCFYHPSVERALDPVPAWVAPGGSDLRTRLRRRDFPAAPMA